MGAAAPRVPDLRCPMLRTALQTDIHVRQTGCISKGETIPLCPIEYEELDIRRAVSVYPNTIII